MDGLQKWDIVAGPVVLTAGAVEWFDIRCELIPESGEYSLQRLHCRVYEVKPITDTPCGQAFLGGRLFGSGEATVVWGEYDRSTRRGELWLLAVPREYTGYYRARRALEALSSVPAPDGEVK